MNVKCKLIKNWKKHLLFIKPFFSSNGCRDATQNDLKWAGHAPSFHTPKWGEGAGDGGGKRAFRAFLLNTFYTSSSAYGYF